MSFLRAAQRSLRIIRLEKPSRHFSVSSVYNEKPVVTPSDESEKPPAKSATSILQDGRNHRVNNLERRFLVWSGKYKRVEDVPATVPQETMEKARNKARIRIANYMMVATVLACIGFIYSGKQAAKRGESVVQMNLDWHKELEEESKKAKEAKAAASK